MAKTNRMTRGTAAASFRFLPALLLLGWSADRTTAVPPPNEETANFDHTQAFLDMQSDIVWPVPLSDRSLIGSTFGPRISACTGEYGFHKGMSIHGNCGDDIVASYEGVVEKVIDLPSEGQTVVIKHLFDNEEDGTITFRGKEMSTWFSFYMHLQDVEVQPGDEVAAGDKIGTMGQCHCIHTAHSFSSCHLEYEVRLGTRCSHAYAAEHGSDGTDGSTCIDLGFDTHVHPMLTMKDHDTITEVKSNGATVTKEATTLVEEVVPDLMSTSGTSIVRIRTDDEQPNINSYHVACSGYSKSQFLHQEYVIDYNHRLGFNQEDGTQDTSNPFLIPVRFGKNKDFWEIQLVIPAGWFPQTDSPPQCDLFVTDVWGHVTSYEISHATDATGLPDTFSVAHAHETTPCPDKTSGTTAENGMVWTPVESPASTNDAAGANDIRGGNGENVMHLVPPQAVVPEATGSFPQQQQETEADPTPTTKAPTTKPTKAPTNKPTKAPTTKPTKAPTTKPTIAPSSVSGRVWDDADTDGVQDPSEGGVFPVIVALVETGDSSNTVRAITDSDGNYQFDDVAPGSYYVDFVPKAGYTFSLQTNDNDADPVTGMTDDFTIEAGVSKTVNAGMHEPQPVQTVSGRVWDDADVDGIQDPSEGGVFPAIVALVETGDSSNSVHVITDSDGYYQFDDVAPGSYYVDFVPKAGYTFSLQTNDNDADPITGMTDDFTIEAGVSKTVNAAMHQPSLTQPVQTDQPTLTPTNKPTPNPTKNPTRKPTKAPTNPVRSSPSSPTTTTSFSSAAGPFRLRLFWDKSYYWQKSKKERWFCMECDKGQCKNGGAVEIQKCSKSKRNQKWITRGKTICSDANRNLCLTRIRNNVYLKPYDADNEFQQWDGFHHKDPFEFFPEGKEADCMTQQHHPKNGESLWIQDTKTVRQHQTSKWVTYDCKKGCAP